MLALAVNRPNTTRTTCSARSRLDVTAIGALLRWIRWLCCHSFEKGVAEHAIGFCRTIEIADPCIEGRGIDDAGRERLLPHGFHHPRERFPRETVDQIRCRRVNVDDAWCHARR